MAGLRVELLVVLTGTLLLVSVRGWERINKTHLFGSYRTDQWDEPPSFTWTGDNDDYDDYDNGEDEAVEVVEGDATSATSDPFAEHGVQEEDEGSDPRNWASISDSGFQVEFINPHTTSWSSSISPGSAELDVFCSETGFHITLPAGHLSDVKVWGSKDLLPVMDAPESCGYVLNPLNNTLAVPFTGCNVRYTGHYSLQLLYVDESDQLQVATATCEESPEFDPDLLPRAINRPQEKQKCNNAPTAPAPVPSMAKNCAIPAGEKVTCGQSGISSSDCEKMGCCVDPSNFACYYPLDECTGDQHFVFAIRQDSASIPVDPTKLVIPGNPNCKPVILNDKVAIFKFKVAECGARAYEVGETKIYLAEVQTVVQALNLKYGIITRSDPLRFMVECRYGKGGSTPHSLASVGYMVKIPSSSLPSAIISNGLYGVQLRIAKDQTYSSYLPTYHQPLRLLLGKPVYLELRLKSPKPDAVITVNYCLAYPRSAKNALVLIYEGCANPYDPNVSILKIDGLPQNRHQRRFMVNAFQFMDQKTNKYLDEEIYFMCSSEVCRPGEKTCVERCFDGKAP